MDFVGVLSSSLGAHAIALNICHTTTDFLSLAKDIKRVMFWDKTSLFVGRFLILIYQNACPAKCCNCNALTEAESDFIAQIGSKTKSDSVTNKILNWCNFFGNSDKANFVWFHHK